MSPEEITAIVYNNLLEIVGWTIATITPVITALTIALGLLWSKLGKKEEEIKRLNGMIFDQQKEYHETLKSLSPYFEKSAEAQSRTYDICEEILKTTEKIDTEEAKHLREKVVALKSSMDSKNEDLVAIKHKMDTIVSLLGTKHGE